MTELHKYEVMFKGENFTGHIGDRTHDIPVYSAVTQPNPLPRIPELMTR
jgi:hypothetical protein